MLGLGGAQELKQGEEGKGVGLLLHHVGMWHCSVGFQLHPRGLDVRKGGKGNASASRS